MQDSLRHMMAQSGVIKKDVEGRFFGEDYPSRGYYIVLPGAGVWYLHHDGKVKNGTNADSGRSAFWPTEKEAKVFFSEWRAKVIKEALGCEEGRSNKTGVERLVEIRKNIEDLHCELISNNFLENSEAESYLTDAAHSLDAAFEEVSAAIRVEQSL